MLGSIPTYQFLQWMEVSGRLEAGARVFSSSGWRFRTVEGLWAY